jgi:putative hemolysin
VSNSAKNRLAMSEIRNPLLRAFLLKLSRIDVLKQWYDEWLQQNNGQYGKDAGAFIDYTLGRLNVSATVLGADLLSSAPQKGPLVIVANHPLGGLEGMLLTKMLLAVRPDLKVLTNEMLQIFPEFDGVFIGVDVLNQSKQRENARGMLKVARHLSGGGALLVFPAGTVSGLQLPSFQISDAPWNPMITRLARKYEAPILPIYVGGRNSLSFYLAGCMGKKLRTLLLPRAMLNKSGTQVPVHVGALVPASDIQRLNEDIIATHYIRFCCKVLRPASQEDHGDELEVETIKHSAANEGVTKHIQNLEPYKIHAQGNFSLYCAPYEALGPVMEQLAIERERAFRQVDEGTGKELDSDRFDPYYTHLFLWDEEQQKIAGGYRIGRADDIVKAHNLDGLYSHSLFDYDKRFLEKMGKAVELGRSFITPKYQRASAPLDMLWKGIGRFIADNPDYHTLFGCVSISRQYSPLATALLSETFLSHYGAEHSLRRNVKARTPVESPKTPWTTSQLASLSGIPIINKLVGRIDSGKSIPVLIRHYLALNGRFVSFTVNKGFNRSLDGLIMVDLRTSSEKYLKRYMGEDGFQKFKTKWENNQNVA